LLEDKILCWQLRRGSKDALRQIYEKYRDDLLRIAVSLTGQISTAEDIVHDVFAKFVESADRFEIKSNLKSYLMTAAANRARDIHRMSANKQTVSIEQAAFIPGSYERPDEWIIEDEQLRLVAGAIVQLSAEQREVVALRLHGDMTFKQIAKTQGTSVGTAISRYRYGIEKLRSLLNGELTDETGR